MSSILPHTSSSYQEALETGLVMDDRHTVLFDTPLIERLREVTGNDRLFFYYHEEVHSWVLAAWVYTVEESIGQPICIEVEVFDRDPNFDSSSNVDVLASMCIPVDVAYENELKRRRDAMRDAVNVRESALSDRTAMLKKLRRSGNYEQADLIERGVTHIASESQVGTEEWNKNKETLLELAKTGTRMMGLVDGTRDRGWL